MAGLEVQGHPQLRGKFRTSLHYMKPCIRKKNNTYGHYGSEGLEKKDAIATPYSTVLQSSLGEWYLCF